MIKKIKEYIDKRIPKAMNMLQSVDWDNWNYNKVTISMEFHPIAYDNKERTAFIPTGSRDKPAGISTLVDDFILFFDPEGKGSPLYMHVDSVKVYMSDNFDKIKDRQGIDRDFNHIGYTVDFDELISSFE